ncbi:MAG: mercuric ion transporter MerT [Pseudohongiellaceae bacterium]
MKPRNLLLNTPRLLSAAILASATASLCCLGPFLMLATGLGGAWMSQIMAVAPYQPLLAVISLTLVAVAGWQLLARRPGDGCCGEATIPAARAQVAYYYVALSLVLILVSSEYWIPVLAG